MTTHTFSVIGKGSNETNFFRYWKKLQYTQPFLFHRVQINASLFSNLVSIASSTSMLKACSASEIVTVLGFTTNYLKLCHCRQNILSETCNCINSGQSLLNTSACLNLIIGNRVKNSLLYLNLG